MATWNSRGLRGSTLEEFINHSNERYSEMGLALMQKIPTPITPVRMDKDHTCVFRQSKYGRLYRSSAGNPGLF